MAESVTESAADFFDVQPPMLVLIVVDDEALAATTTRKLGLMGRFQVDAASLVDEAVEMLKWKGYDVVVSNIVGLREAVGVTPFLLLAFEDDGGSIDTSGLDVAHFPCRSEVDFSELSRRIREAIEIGGKFSQKPVLRVKGATGSVLDSLMCLVQGRPMKWSEAIIYATVFSYVTAAATTFTGYPLQDPATYSSILQVAFYVVMALLLILSRRYRLLRPAMAAVFGVVAMLSFSGVQRWVNYNGDSSLLGPLMSIWYLTLAVALMSD